jgi:hypothetical protein
MSFRDKEKRRGPIDKRTTIDAVHNDKIKQYIYEEKNIPALEKELAKLEKDYIKLDYKPHMELMDKELHEKLEIIDNIKKIKKDIEIISNKKERTKYYLDTGSLIFDYYENNNSSNINLDPKTTSIINMFQKEQVKPKTEQKKTNKTSILNQYMSYMDDEYITPEKDIDLDTCSICNSNMFLLPTESIMVCKGCGTVEEIIINSDKPSYKDPPREVSYFAYKRINHFNEWLAQFQAKESTEIPSEVYEKILLELKKEKIFDTHDLLPDKLREILKKLKYNKYYEHVPHIINHLNGVPAPSMSRNTEEKLRMMFKEIQTPFVKYCPKERKNFLSYSYVLHKFCELLSMDEYLECFPLLKSREKLQQQDNIWEKICRDLQWQFIPST